MSVNYHLLADFRVGHEKALDEMFTHVLAVLVEKGIVSGDRISQDGIRTRAAAASGSFRSQSRLELLLQEARAHVEVLKGHLNDPQQSAAESAARQRDAREREQRIQEAIAQLPELKRRQEKTAEKAGKGKRGQKVRDKVLRAAPPMHSPGSCAWPTAASSRR